MRIWFAMGLSGLLGACGDSGSIGAVAQISEETCRAGSGEVRADDCRDGTSPISAEVPGPALCCTAMGFVTPEQCNAMGGRALADPGDGSLKRCPADSAKIADVSGFIEGGLCCD
jgi:hypothetical protein